MDLYLTITNNQCHLLRNLIKIIPKNFYSTKSFFH